jgi:hypothetical protein
MMMRRKTVISSREYFSLMPIYFNSCRNHCQGESITKLFNI